MYENYLNGIQTLSTKTEPQIQWRIKGYKKMLILLFPLAFMSGLLFFGKNFHKRWKQTMARSFKMHPLLFPLLTVAGIILLPAIHIYSFCGSILHWVRPHGDQPATSVKAYNNAK